MPKKGHYVKFRNYEIKIESPFMIFADFESILVLEDNRNLNPKESYVNKYQKHIAWSYGRKLVYVDDKFSKPFKTYWSKDTVYCLLDILSIVWSKKVNIVATWWKNILTNN